MSLHSLRTLIAKVTPEKSSCSTTRCATTSRPGQPDVPKQKIIDAAKAALAHELIEQEYAGRVRHHQDEKKGLRCSGGERRSVWPSPALC